VLREPDTLLVLVSLSLVDATVASEATRQAGIFCYRDFVKDIFGSDTA